MIAKFQDLTIKVGDATISATDRVGQHISRTALEAVRHLENGIEKSDDLPRDVCRAHRMGYEVYTLLEGLKVAALELKDGRVAETLRTTDMLVEMLRQLEPDTDFTDLNDTKQRLEDTVDKLNQSKKICIKRLDEITAACKRITTIAVAKSNNPTPFLVYFNVVDEIEIGKGPSKSDIADQHKLLLNEVRSQLFEGAFEYGVNLTKEQCEAPGYSYNSEGVDKFRSDLKVAIDNHINTAVIDDPSIIANTAARRAGEVWVEEAKALCLEWYSDRLASKSKSKAYKRQKQAEQTRKELQDIWGDS